MLQEQYASYSPFVYKIPSYKDIIDVYMQALEKAGLIPGGDMTPEAALTKLSYIITRTDLSIDEKKEVTQIIISLNHRLMSFFFMHRLLLRT